MKTFIFVLLFSLPAYAGGLFVPPLTGVSGDVTASGAGVVAATVNSVGGSTAANVHTAEVAANAATSAATASTIVKRDANGNFLGNLPNAGVTLIDHFMTNSGAGNLGWVVSSSGSGSGTGAETTPITSATHAGVVGCYTGTSGTGRCSMNLGQQILIGAGAITQEAMIDIPTLSTVGDEYIFRSGIIDTGAAAPSAGVWFSYDRLNLGTHWFCNTAHATAVTATDSAVVASAGWHKLKLIINAAGTSADFYVDGVDVCPAQTGNFPTSSDLLGIYPNGIFKSAGAANSSTKIDYLYYNQSFTTPL